MKRSEQSTVARGEPRLQSGFGSEKSLEFTRKVRYRDMAYIVVRMPPI